jgi:nucleoid-associated protein YgaU
MPTIIRAEGPIPFSYLRWVISNIEQLEVRQRPSDWALCYADLKLTLTEWTDPDLIVQGPKSAASPAAAAQTQVAEFSQQVIAENPKLAIAYNVPYAGVQQSQPRTYTVHKGDTLSKIAAAQLGKASRWTEIASLNNIRDPNRINVGQVLNLPVK